MKYVCPVCGYVYDEEKEKVPFLELPDSWVCPLCGAVKSVFKPAEENETLKKNFEAVKLDEDMQKVSFRVISSIFSNLSRGSEKQYRFEEKELFSEIAEYFALIAPDEKADINTLEDLVSADLQSGYPSLSIAAKNEKDRGTQRICVWGEKVTNIVNSVLSRYRKEGGEAFCDTEIWVCSVCGFIYIGDKAPSICPVCKVPDWKFDKIERRQSL